MRKIARTGRNSGVALALIGIAALSILARAKPATDNSTPAADSSATAMVAGLACEAGRAYAGKDIETLEKMTADDYVQTDVRGGVLSREAYLRFVRDRSSALTIACSDIRVRMYHGVAVATGEWIYTRKTHSGDVTTRTRWTSIWTREHEGWRRHVFQNTYINPNADRDAAAYASK